MLLTGFYMYISFKMYCVKINQEAEKKRKKKRKYLVHFVVETSAHFVLRWMLMYKVLQNPMLRLKRRCTYNSWNPIVCVVLG